MCGGATDRDSGNFMIKNYHPIHKCLPSNKKKMCTTKFLAKRFKDKITNQPSLRIWETQELCRKELGLHVGKTISYKGKIMIMYFYVCLDAMKKGWKEECRRIIGFDGCFLTGACKGELLVLEGMETIRFFL